MKVELIKGDSVKFLSKDSALIEILLKDGWKLKEEKKPVKKSKK